MLTDDVVERNREEHRVVVVVVVIVRSKTAKERERVGASAITTKCPVSGGKGTEGREKKNGKLLVCVCLCVFARARAVTPFSSVLKHY